MENNPFLFKINYLSKPDYIHEENTLIILSSFLVLVLLQIAQTLKQLLKHRNA